MEHRLIKRLRGFTLVELLVAMAIIAVLIGLAIGAISIAQRVSRDSQRRGALVELSAAVNAYYASRARYPNKSEISKSGGSPATQITVGSGAGSQAVRLSGVAVSSSGSQSTIDDTIYCYQKTTSGYILGALMEDGTVDVSQSTDQAAAASFSAANCSSSTNRI
jgi:prepilin-type N-terminal cleavage/methylation domain-containing protein